MGQLVSWVSSHVRRQTLLSLVLLLVIFGCLVYGVAGAVQGIERGLLWPIVWLGLLLGCVLAHSTLSGWLAAIVSLMVGGALTLLRVGRMGGSLVTLLGELVSLVGQVIQGSIPPDAAPVLSAWAALGSGVGTLGARLYTWVLALANGQPLIDPVPIALLWGLALWGTVIWVIWAVRRRGQPLLGVVPAFALLASTLAYVGGRAFYLLPMLTATLVLKALVGHERRRRHWEQTGLRHSARVRADSAWMALGLSLGLMVIAALTPSISVYRVVDFLHSLSQEQANEQDVAQSLGLEPQPRPVPVDVNILHATRSPGLPTRRLIGSGPELSEQVVMVISIEPTLRGATAASQQAAGQQAAAGDAVDQPVPRHYWRGLSYDQYTGRGWATEGTAIVDYAAGEFAIPDLVSLRSSRLRRVGADRRLLRQKVRLVKDKGRPLYVAGSLLTADRDYQVAWRALPDAVDRGDVFGATIDAVSYRADSLLPVTGEAELRATGQDYSRWVVERYLALPDSVPDRVLALARDLTATELTPYDRALAIERYLRGFPYTLDLPAPPTDRDIVDYFLFDLQQGYCDYYATAMVVLVRAAGLPARLVTGYISGTYDEVEARYVITEEQAHSWVEIYFPGYGWIEFEPTAGRSAIERPTEYLPEVPLEFETPLEPITAYRVRLNWALWLGAAVGLLVVAVGGLLVWLVVDGWRLRRVSPKTAVIDLYRRLYRYGRWLGVPPRQGATTQEFKAALVLCLTDLVENRRWGGLLVSALGEIGWLVDLSTRALYSLHEPHAGDRRRAIQAWMRLRARLWLARLLTWSPWSEKILPGRFWQAD